MPSPLCQVKDGAGAFQPTTNGNDVTAGNTITIDLIDKGVSSWTLQCLTTDELSSKATPNAAITASFNPVTKQATFVAPVAGRTYRFQSQVDGGTSADGRPRASYTTTFCVYVPAPSGRRCIAADEETEGDPEFGWIAAYNQLVRNPTALVAPGVATRLLASDGAGGLVDSGLTGAAGVLGATTANVSGTATAALVVGTAMQSDDYKDASGAAQLLGYAAGDAVLGAGATAARHGSPAKGLLGFPVGLALINMADANYAALAAEYDCFALKENGAVVFTGIRNLTLPDAAIGSTYFRWVWNANANAVSMTVSDVSNPAQAITITDGEACLLMITSTGVYRMASWINPNI